jgi:hypothetical protein
VLNDALKSMYNAEKRGKRQVMKETHSWKKHYNLNGIIQKLLLAHFSPLIFIWIVSSLSYSVVAVNAWICIHAVAMDILLGLLCTVIWKEVFHAWIFCYLILQLWTREVLFRIFMWSWRLVLW